MPARSFGSSAVQVWQEDQNVSSIVIGTHGDF